MRRGGGVKDCSPACIAVSASFLEFDELIGAPGTEKTMLAKRIPTILPPMSLEEAIETTRIHSVAGTLENAQGLIGTRPFRSPHHTVSDAGLIGGGAVPRPGEVALGHNGGFFSATCWSRSRTAW